MGGAEEPLPDLEKLQELLKKHEARLELKEKSLKARLLGIALGYSEDQGRMLQFLFHWEPHWTQWFPPFKAQAHDFGDDESKALELSLYRLLCSLHVRCLRNVGFWGQLVLFMPVSNKLQEH